MNKVNLIKTLPFYISVIFFSKVFGLIRDLILSYFFGASIVTDTFLFSISIPELLFPLFSSVILVSYMNSNKLLLKNDNTLQYELNYKYIYVYSMISILIYFSSLILLSLFLYFINSLFTSQLLTFSSFSMATIFFVSIWTIYSGFIQINGTIIYIAISQMIQNIIVSLFIFIASIYGNVFLPIGFLIGSISQFVFLYIVSKKFGFKIRKIHFSFKVFLNEIKDSYFYLSLNLLLLVYSLIEKFLSQLTFEGGLTLLTYSNRINLLVQGLFSLSIISFFYPKLIRSFKFNLFEQLRQTLFVSFFSILIVLVPLTFLCIYFSYDIVYFLLGGSKISGENLILIQRLFIIISIGMIGHSTRDLLGRFLIVLNRSNYYFVFASFGYLILPLYFIVFKDVNLINIALFSSMGGYISSFFMAIIIRKHLIPHFGMYIKLFISIFFSLIVSFLLNDFIFEGEFIIKSISFLFFYFLSLTVPLFLLFNKDTRLMIYKSF